MCIRDRLYVEDLSETEEQIPQQKSWKNLFSGKKGMLAPSDNAGDLVDLRKKNEEMKEMIIQLQKSVDALKK